MKRALSQAGVYGNKGIPSPYHEHKDRIYSRLSLL